MVDQRSAIADAWYQALHPIARRSGLLDPSEVRVIVDRLTRRIVELLHQEQPWSADAVDPVAADLLALGLPHAALTSLQEILIRHLIERPPGLHPPLERASALTGALTASLLRCQEALILEEQERMRRADALARQREQAHLLLTDAAARSFAWGLALWIFDGHIVYANPAFRTLWGCDQRQALELSPISALWGGEPALETIHAAVRQAGVWLGQVSGVRGDGSPVMAMVAASPVEADDHASPLVMGSFDDMTDPQGVGHMLQQRIERLRALHRVDRGILAARSPRAIAEAALQHTHQLLPSETVSVILFAPGDERARFLAAVPPDAFGERPGRGFPLAGFEDFIDGLQRGELITIDAPHQLAVSAEAAERLGRAGPGPIVVVPLRSEEDLLGSLNLTLEPGGELSGQQQAIAREIAASLAVAIRQAQLNLTIAEHEERLRALTARLAESDEAERRRLARDLHDEIGQNLTVLGLNLSVVRAQLEGGGRPALTARLDDSLELIKATTERLRRVMADLRPPMLDEYGLLPTLRWCGQELSRRTGVQVTVEGVEPRAQRSAAVEDALVRITQEALTNVAKHAEATRVTIRLSETEQGLQLTIEDDGVGFDEGSADPPDSHHWGLLTMTERAAAVGARCSIDAQAGAGTRITVEVRR